MASRNVGKTSIFTTTIIATAALLSASGMSLAKDPAPENGRGSEKRANVWYDNTAWPVGANFLPSTAINQLEMWQAATFDPETIDRELGYAAGIGMNTMRVFLHDIPWREDAEGFFKRVDRYLEIADRHKIRTMLVIFDGVWYPHPKTGKQPDPKPGVHNSGWVQSPGRTILEDSKRQDALKPYVQAVIRRYKDDRRVLVWDLFNEADNPNHAAYGEGGTKEELAADDKIKRANELLRKSFAWAREVDPSQPLTCGVWRGDFLNNPTAYDKAETELIRELTSKGAKSATSGRMKDTVKIAAAQVDLTPNSQNTIIKYIDRAGTDGADMIVLPEYIMDAFTLPYAPDSHVAQVAAAAKRNHIYVIVGGWEEFEKGALAELKEKHFSNTALLFGRDGEIIGKYRKVHGAVGEPPHFWPPKPKADLEWLMQEGNEFPVFDLDFGKVGIMICYDGYFPETANILSLNGAEIVAWINGREGSIEDFIVRADMYRNYIAMVATNLGPGKGTMIGTWPERILAKIDQTGSHYIVADIDLKDLRFRRANSRVHHQKKPAAYKAITEPMWLVNRNQVWLFFS